MFRMTGDPPYNLLLFLGLLRTFHLYALGTKFHHAKFTIRAIAKEYVALG